MRAFAFVDARGKPGHAGRGMTPPRLYPVMTGSSPVNPDRDRERVIRAQEKLLDTSRKICHIPLVPAHVRASPSGLRRCGREAAPAVRVETEPASREAFANAGALPCLRATRRVARPSGTMTG